MKFEKRFQEEIVPEWKIKYIDYKGLKKKLKNIQRSKSYAQNNKRSKETANYYNDSQPRSRLEQTEISSPPIDKSYKRLSAHSQAFSMSTVAESIQDFFHKVSSALVTIQKQQDPAEDSSPGQINSLDTLAEDVSPKERLFFSALDGELDKIENFYKIKEREATTRMNLLTQQYEILKEKKNEKKNEKKQSFIKQGLDYLNLTSSNLPNPSDSKSSSTISLDGQDKILSVSLDERQKHYYRTAKQNIKKAIFEFYRGAELLRKYRVLNYNGFSKILKSYDKVTGRNGTKVYMTRVKNCYFIQSGVMKKLLKEAEDFYTDNFESGSRSQAIRKLRTPNKKNKTYYFPTLRVGIYLGFALPAFIHLIGLMHERDSSTGLDSALWDNLLGLYSGFFLIIVLALLIGINMYAWSTSHINYRFILELDPRNNLDFKQYLELPALFFLALIYIMLLNFMDEINFIRPYTYPAFLVIFICVVLFNPYPAFYYNARKWFIFSSARLFGSGLLRVEFRDYFLADLFTSLSYSMITLQFFGCNDKTCDFRTSYSTPILGSIPPLFRLLQCYRRYSDTKKLIHVTNLCKYGSTIISVWMTYFYNIGKDSKAGAAITILWWFSQIISSTYTFGWDVKVDWSLLRLDSTNYLLRNELGYEHHWIYYYAIISNLFLRFSWIFTRIFSKNLMVVFAVASGEMFRRWQWNFFRVESEHVINCGEFRAVKEMPLPFRVEEILIGELDYETTDFDRAASLTSWSTWSKRMFSKHQARRSLNPADSWKDFEPRNNTPGYAYSENIYEDSEEDDDSYDDDDNDLGALNARNTVVSMARVRGSLGISNAYASRSFLPISELDNDNEVV